MALTRQDFFIFTRLTEDDVDVDEVDSTLKRAERIVNRITTKKSEIRDDAILTYAAWRIFNLQSPDILIHRLDSNILNVISGGANLGRGSEFPDKMVIAESLNRYAKQHRNEFLDYVSLLQETLTAFTT